MPAARPIPAGAPIWFDLGSSDTDRAAEFYGALFGWRAEPTPEGFGGYINFTLDGALIGGLMYNDPVHRMPDAWTVYLRADDAEAARDLITKNGGTVVLGPHDVSDLGRMIVAVDPGGAVFGVWQPGTMVGTALIEEPGAPAWYELHTRDYDTVLPFYQRALGWKTRVMSDAAEFRYTVLQPGERELAGVMDAAAALPAGTSFWELYIGVADVDATVAAAVAAGGSVVKPAEDSEFGRMADLRDPMGAAFTVISV